ncbi:LuxR C-terminal-related transcriptional regulator [Scandinavium sp. V105_16]|uniref:LuxR C-terminal-related transcriptional regulator n=1 Tax=Scandinavium lactucae TaxID=3095028 RepID=A0AAJ2S9V0_9ENTR|nr:MULTISPECIES: LuxR C-terminal-related transcriptional regulator [unclassified Scandinavium]MDX6019653.1 LuxR C-terminal-related transcriptional regulator [Scandinavium sp. V105_16]MDX6032688.1 LuxR C-terminal-related transcriptional regulator [Scandinavium sp. V105_12]
MYKILIIDRCCFTRLGLEKGLQQFNGDSSPFLVTQLNSLLLAKAHVESWRPHLVIADFNDFQHDLKQSHFLPALLAVCEQRSRLIRLQDEPFLFKNVGDVIPKKAPLETLFQRIMEILHSGPIVNPARTAMPLLTRQEKKVLSLWMEGASNQAIASEMQINGKTVYTYKRNIRMKLKVENRFSPFIPSAVTAECVE